MFKNALAHVQNCYKALFIYAGITAGYVALKVVVETFLLQQGIDTSDPESLTTQYYITTGLLDAFFYSLAAALAFPILGREIDKPLWKFEFNFTNVLHFFSLWFTLYLMIITARLLILLSNIPVESKESLIIYLLLGHTLLIPLGSTIMFYGHMSRETLGVAIQTLFSQFPYYLATFIATFFLYTYFIQILSASFPPTALPLLEIVSAYAECVIFAFCWELCKKHREEEENSDDFDF